jgi:hypothetical protein
MKRTYHVKYICDNCGAEMAQAVANRGESLHHWRDTFCVNCEGYSTHAERHKKNSLVQTKP